MFASGPGRHPLLGRHTPEADSADTPLPPPDTTGYGQQAGKRVARIPLECILVFDPHSHTDRFIK